MAGASINELGEKHNISSSTIWRNIARLGLPVKDRETSLKEKRERTIRTCMARYGVEHVGQVDSFKHVMSPESKAKAESSRKKTLLVKLGRGLGRLRDAWYPNTCGKLKRKDALLAVFPGNIQLLLPQDRGRHINGKFLALQDHLIENLPSRFSYSRCRIVCGKAA